ncbi:pol, partial [Symbiodinium sp. CCMP2592]
MAPQFQSSDWTVLTSPTVDCKAAGLVVLLDKQFCDQGQLTYADPLPGRVQHVRLASSKWTLDLFNLYQKPQTTQKNQAAASKELRKKVWHTLRAEVSRAHWLEINTCCSSSLRIINLCSSTLGAVTQAPPTCIMLDTVSSTTCSCEARMLIAWLAWLAAWRQGGRHLPLVGTVRLQLFQKLNRPPPQSVRTWDHWTLVQTCLDQQDPRILQLRHRVGQCLPQVQTLAELDQVLTTHAAAIFPAPEQPQRLAVWQTPAMQGGLKAMWQAYRAWKRPVGAGLRDILTKWRSYQLFQQKQRAFKKAGKEAKKHWFQSPLADLQHAAQSKDTRLLYAGVRSLAPKSRRIAVQLRDASGCMQDASAQAEQLRAHYEKLYQAPAESTPPPPPSHIQMDVTDTEVLHALDHLPIHKAVPRGMATTSLWRSCSDVLACSTPARKLMDAYENKPRSSTNQGGLQLSLDLTSAFDVLSWRLLSEAMQAAHIPSELQDWVSSWYSEVTYHIRHLGWEKWVQASQGVRQGCLLAPLLWGLCTGYLLVTLQQATTIEWVAQSVTGYADDFHASDMVTSYATLVRAESRLGSLLDVLADAQMRINSKKSAILLRVCGRFAKRRCFEFPLKDQHVYLGVTISYYSAAKHTVAYRMQAANQAWQRLRKILCSRTQLDVRKRIAIWRATVIPTLLYGLAATAPAMRDLQRIQHQLTKQLRAITHLYAHLSKVSTTDLHSRYGVPTALDILHKDVRATAAQLQVWQAEQWSPSIDEYTASMAYLLVVYVVCLVLLKLLTLLWPCPQIPHRLINLQCQPLLKQGQWVDLANPGMTGFTLDYMDLDDEEAKFFGSDPQKATPPTKRPRPEESHSMTPMIRGKGKNGKGKGKGKGKPTAPATRWDYASGSDQWEAPWTNEMIPPYYQGDRSQDPYRVQMWNLTRLVLQQEQTLASLRQDITLYLFVKTGQGSIVSLLHQTAEKWRQAKEISPQTLTYSLKIAMFKQLMIELHGRLTAVAKDTSEMEKARKLNWTDERGHWRVLKWDLLKQTVELRKGVTEEALHRFRSYKKMTEQPVTEWMQFRLEISLRPLGDPIWNTLQTWVGQAAWHLLGCRLRRERPQYNGLVDQVGVVQRDPRPLTGHLHIVHLPVFKAGSEAERCNLECEHLPYQVVAMALHHGASPTEGHYQAVLCGQPFYGGDKKWLTDDNRTACIHKHADSALHRKVIVRDTPLGCEGAVAVLQTGARHIFLDACDLGDDEACAIADVLRQLPSVENLTLRNTQITREGFKELEEASKVFNSVSLDVHTLQVTAVDPVQSTQGD